MEKELNQINFIYWFAYYNEDSPSVRYRAKYPLKFFKKKYGVGFILIIPGYKLNRIYIFIKAYLSALLFRKKNSLIVIQRVHSNFIYSSLLKFLVTIRRSNTVYDLDDADYLYCPTKTIYFFAKKCAHISAGSSAIYKHLSKFNKSIVITSSPTPDIEILKKKKNSKFTIGWIGGFGGDHKKGLINLVFPAINNLEIEIRFTILGITKTEDFDFVKKVFLKNTNIEIDIPKNIDWNNEEEMQKRIVDFDIGIATLINTEIQLSKSGIKVKQYLNNGVPVLSTNLPENNPFVIDGSNGYFCSTPSEFEIKIIEFYEMKNETYMTFSRNAKNTSTKFNLDKYYSDLMKIKTLNILKHS